MIIAEDEAHAIASTIQVRLSEYGVAPENWDVVERFCEELRQRAGVNIECIKK